MQPLLTTHDKRAESFRLIGQVGPLHRLRRLADLELDGVVLKEIGDDGGLDREIHILRDIAGVLDLAQKIQLRRDDADEIAVFVEEHVIPARGQAIFNEG